MILGIVLRGFFDKHPDLEIIHGAARGADKMADEFAKQFGIPRHPYPARWNDYSKSERWRAGHDRNRQMLEEG